VAVLPWLCALVGLVAGVQAMVWIGQPSAPVGRRLIGVFTAPVAILLLAVALAATRVPSLMFG
jgi:hypothetical protein